MHLSYIDDVLLFSKDHDSHQQLLSHFLEIVETYGIMLSDKKSILGQNTVTFLGMTLKDGYYSPRPHIAHASKGLKLETLKVSFTLYPPGKSNLYALLLVHSKTWKGQSPRGNNLDFLCSKSSSLTSLCHPLLACLTYYSVLYSMLNFAISCICLKISAFFFPSKLTCSEIGNGVKELK